MNDVKLRYVKCTVKNFLSRTAADREKLNVAYKYQGLHSTWNAELVQK